MQLRTTHVRRRFAAALAAVALGLGGAVGLPVAALADDAQCRSVPAPAAGLLNAAEAWTAFGVDGTGVRVGIISDSFNTSAVPTAQDDVAAGVLPGPGNPCGREIPVQVVAEAPQPGSDEGRAMAQLVHGVAPGAEILFSYTEDSNEGLAAAIQRLRDAGADVIVDDVGLEDDLFFERGAADVAVAEAVAAGVVYLAAAGNYSEIGDPGYPSEGFLISGWSSSEYRPTACPPAVVAAAQAAQSTPVAVDCMDFDSAAAEDAVLTATLPPEVGVPTPFYWAEPQGALSTRFGIALTDIATGDVEFGWAQEAGVPRVEAGLASFGQSAPIEKGVSFVRQLDPTAGTPAVALVVESNSRSNSLADLEYFRSTDTDTIGVTLKGHQAEPATLAVAAVDAQTLTLETFSSAGPATTRIGVPAPVTVEGPAMAGVDGLPISFSLDGGGTTFYGTSAASPTVAAVAALVRQASPEAGPERVREILAATARPNAFTSPWNPELAARRFTGAGLVDAAAAVASVVPAPLPTSAPIAGAPVLAESGGTAPGSAAGAAVVTMIAGVALVVARRRSRTTAQR